MYKIGVIWVQNTLSMRTDDLESRILAMYAKGNEPILKIICDIYGIEASASLITRITDKIMPAATEWMSRPLDSIYPIVGIVFKVRKDSKVVNKCVYTVLGINMDGKKDILILDIRDRKRFILAHG